MIIYIFLLAYSVFLIGCRPSRPDSQLSREKVPEEGQCLMLDIENLTVTEKALTLDYEVSNPFTHDIRICQDIDTEGKYDVETRIDAETVWIKLRFNLARNFHRDPPAIAKYLRLPRGEPHSGRIILNLPIRNASPVYDFEERRKKRKQIVLHRAVFEVGYFGGEFGEFFDVASEILKEKGIKRNIQVIGGRKLLLTQPLIVEEIQDSQPREVVYVDDLWSSIKLEKSARVVVTDVDIPCSVVDDDKE
jgi:hypothetical protein